MKVISVLPDKKLFKPITSTKEGVYLFEDKNVKALKIRATTPDPWRKENVILFAHTPQKADRSLYYYKLVLRVYPIRDEDIDIPKAKIYREQFKGVYAYSNCPTINFFAFPIAEKLWITYSVTKR